MIVDDEAPIRDMLKDAFTSEGYDAICAESAEEAREILKRDKPQIMFLDLKLPGMNGVELCRRIREDHPIACIYAMTGYTSLFDLAECREVGFDDYFVKPVDLKQFFTAVEEALEKLDRWAKR
jgi:DNA-binding response OmpR family regulator